MCRIRRTVRSDILKVVAHFLVDRRGILRRAALNGFNIVCSSYDTSLPGDILLIKSPIHENFEPRSCVSRSYSVITIYVKIAAK